jgi:hypothetical protein
MSVYRNLNESLQIIAGEDLRDYFIYPRII